jgi:hypothetical protein
MEVDEKSKELLLRLLTIAGPLYATSLAVGYDVGFFLGIDIGFFTFYSISEHFVFSLQALPWAFIPALTIFSSAYILVYGYHRNKKELAVFVEKFKAASPAEQNEERARLQKEIKRNKAVSIIVWISCVATVAISIQFHNYTTAFLAAVSQITFWFAFRKNRLDSQLVRLILVFVLISTGWIASFLLGYERAVRVLKSDAPQEVIQLETGEHKARIIRSGEKGLLFRSFETGKPTFLRWDVVKKIEVL